MEKLELLRAQIEIIDRTIIEKLAERQAVVYEIGQLKARMGMQITDVERERQLSTFYTDMSLRYKIQPEFIQEIFTLILHHSKELQER